MPVGAIAVIGAGAMGSGIAQVGAVAGLGVILIEVSDAAVEKGLEGIRRNLQKLVAKGKMTQADKDAALGSIRGTTALEDVAPADVVIEAVTENYEIKLDLLQRLDALAPAETIIASNTSSIAISPDSRRRYRIRSASSGCTSSTRCRSWRWSRSFAASRPVTRRTTP